MYFEMGDKLRDAVESFSMVKEEAKPYGDEALLGVAWSWIKAGQPQLAMQKVDRLISLHPQSPLVPEAHLLKGYTLLLQKRYVEAIPAFERCLAVAEGKFLTDEDVKERKIQNDQAQDGFSPTADKIKKNALRKPTPRSIEERGELYKTYEAFAKENQEFFEYKVVAKSHKQFFMRKEEIVEDATFALAKATSIIKTRGQTKQLEGLRDQGERLDEEIERLRREVDGE
jgi:tetratricopeptide (TPR) repeat protein